MTSRGATLTKKTLGVLLVLFVVLSTSFKSAGAQTPTPGTESLTVSPPTIELDATPGATIKRKVIIDNGANSARSVKVIVQNFGAAGESGSPELTDMEGPYSLANWIKVSPSQVTIGPKESKEFEVSVSIPKNPPPGGRFGALIFEPAPAGGSPEEQVKVVSRVSSLLLLRVPGEATEKLAIESFDATKTGGKVDEAGVPVAQNFFQKGPINFFTRVKNEGNVHVKPKVEVNVFNLFGRKVATIEPTNAGNALPDAIRRYDSEWKHSTLLGYYKAEVKVTYPTAQGEQVLTSSKTIWGANLGLLVGLAVAVIGLFVLVWLPRKRWRKAFKALASSGE